MLVPSEAPGYRMRQIELAQRTLWSKSRLSHQLSRMEHRGQVRREVHAENSRAIDVVPTAAGLRAIQDAAPRHVESVRRHFIELLTDDQIDDLADIAEAVVRHLGVSFEPEHWTGRFSVGASKPASTRNPPVRRPSSGRRDEKA